MTDKEFFSRAFIAILPCFAEKTDENTCIARAEMLARMATGRLQSLGMLDGESPTVLADRTLLPVATRPTGQAGGVQGIVSADPSMRTQAPILGQNHGNLVSTSPITTPVVVGPVG